VKNVVIKCPLLELKSGPKVLFDFENQILYIFTSNENKNPLH